ncbi:MAG: HAD family phosphatase [Candidatus Aenigmatarchaeota archaeon]
MNAVIFDVDGVVVDSEPYHMRSIRIILRPFGVRYSNREYAKRFAGTGSRYIITTLVKEKGVRANIEKLVEERTTLYQRLIARHKLKTFPGFKALLRALKRRKIPIALASGGHRINVISSLKAAGLRPSDFPVKITVEDVPQRKPHPRIFLAAARALRAKPRDCVVIEDSIVGVQAAKRAGMRCIALLTTAAKKDLKSAGADLIVKDFRDPRLWRWLGVR